MDIKVAHDIKLEHRKFRRSFEVKLPVSGHVGNYGH